MRTVLHTVVVTWLALAAQFVNAQSPTNQHYLLAEYQGVSAEAADMLDDYFRLSLLPAANRLGINPIGVFLTKPNESDLRSFYVLMPSPDASALLQFWSTVSGDEEFKKTAGAYFNRDVEQPVFSRIRSELLVAFDCHPLLRIPNQTEANEDRFFELRTYESATEGKADRKVEMFNEGEVPIFLEAGIQPVFFGQAIVGDRLPNLTYMTVYSNTDQRDEQWATFRELDSWKTFSRKPKYAKTVSKIHKTDLFPRDYSQL